MTIGYLTFGRDDFSYGLALCMEDAKARLPGNAHWIRVTPKTANLCDVLIFSVFWWEHVWCLADFLRRANLKKGGRPRIVVGGFNAFNPLVLHPYADAVVCGDGEDGALVAAILDEDHPSIYRGTGRAKWNSVPAPRPRLHVTRDIGRIEIARGCRARCAFCQVAHLKPYRECAPEDVRRCLIEAASRRLRRVSLFAPEPTYHKHDEEFTDVARRLGLARVDSDVRLDRLHRRTEGVPRVGLEGLSERLRKSIRKPRSNEKVVEAVKEAINAKRRGLFLYLILDLPGETDDDWREFADLLVEIGHLPGANNFLLKPSPSVFMPGPFTPLENEGINWDRDYAGKWSQFFGRGPARHWEVQMAERSRVFSPASRILSMIATRGAGEFYEVERLLAHNGVVVVSGGRPHCTSLERLLICLRPWGGPERWCGYGVEPVWRSAVALE